MKAQHLVMAAKSPWLPSIRREHALVGQALASGYDVDFVEQPADVRALRPLSTSGQFLRGLNGVPSEQQSEHGRVTVWRRSNIVPGHRGAAGLHTNSLLLRQVLARVTTDRSVVVCQTPWDWSAVQATSAKVRVFDCTDSWTALMPHRARMLRGLYARIAREADRVVVVNPSLAADFPGADVRVVRNGVSSALLAQPTVPRPGARRMVSVGTLSERFDVRLVAQVLALLPGWSLDLYGQCRYAGRGDEPSQELTQLLEAPGSNVRWRGVVERAALAGVLDSADVLVVANRPELSEGQSSMKVFDYAARGRPIVTSVPAMADSADSPPSTRCATTAEDFAAAVVQASQEAEALAEARREWAAGATWTSRWEEWQSAVLGSSRHLAAAQEPR